MYLLGKSGTTYAEGTVLKVHCTWGDENPKLDVEITHLLKRPLRSDMPRNFFDGVGKDESEFRIGAFVLWEALLCKECPVEEKRKSVGNRLGLHCCSMNTLVTIHTITARTFSLMTPRAFVILNKESSTV